MCVLGHETYVCVSSREMFYFISCSYLNAHRGTSHLILNTCLCIKKCDQEKIEGGEKEKCVLKGHVVRGR